MVIGKVASEKSHWKTVTRMLYPQCGSCKIEAANRITQSLINMAETRTHAFVKRYLSTNIRTPISAER